MNSIHITYDRGSNMADVNLQTRKLSLLSLYKNFINYIKKLAFLSIVRDLLNLNETTAITIESSIKALVKKHKILLKMQIFFV